VAHGVGEYVCGNVRTNTIEDYFSILKRGLTGVSQHVGAQHLSWSSGASVLGKIGTARNAAPGVLERCGAKHGGARQCKEAAPIYSAAYHENVML
jgi:hypothetical protein